MNRLPQHELFNAERPIRSEYSREPNYARRRVITILVLLTILCWVGYALFGRTSTSPSEIPTIVGEGAYKQKPADPGGIDIPHQDVLVYDQIEGKGTAQPIEHLLPPPETPKEFPAPSAATNQPEPLIQQPAPTAATTVAPAPVPAPAPTPEPVASAPAPKADTPASSPESKQAETKDTKAQQPAPAVASSPEPKSAEVQQIAAKPTPPAHAAKAKTASVKSVAASAAPQKSLDKVIEKLNTKAASADSKEKAAIQLASLPDEAQAHSMMAKLQQKYASELEGAKLHITRADLGSRGVYYRIQSDILSKDKANRICSSLKKLNAGCILVGK